MWKAGRVDSGVQWRRLVGYGGARGSERGWGELSLGGGVNGGGGLGGGKVSGLELR